MQRIVLASGCFWCTQAVFQRLKGVEKTVCVYANGHMPNPTYEQVCSETSGHAEAVEIFYSQENISLSEILAVFWQTHNPTSLNRQGHDIGTRYRSAIYYTQPEQLPFIKKSLQSAQENFSQKIVTQIEPLNKIYEAETYHQNYYDLNLARNPYCATVITPKLEKLQKITS